MVKKIALGVGAFVLLVVGGVLIAAAMQPDTFRIARSTTVKAPPEKIYPFINQLKEWEKWSPWEKIDPKMQKTYTGPESGKGAKYAWDGDDNIGSGSMEITEVTEPTHVGIRLIFIRPFACENQVDFTLEPQGDSTKVTWAMEGPSPYMAKIMHLFLSMDAMVGGPFEEGLAGLKKLGEEPAASPASAVASTPAP